MEPSVNTELLRSRVDTFILKSLYEKDGYGYDILNYIDEKTQGHYNMKQSSIYSVLKRLEKQGYINSYVGDESKGGPRRYYSLSDKGREYLVEEQKQWAYTRTLLDNLVSDNPFDLEKDTPPFKPSDLRPLTKRNKSEEELIEEKKEVIQENKFIKEEPLKQNEQKLQIARNEEAKQLLFSPEIKEIIPPKEEPAPRQEKNINSDYKSIFDDIYKNVKKNQEEKATSTPKEIPSFKDEELNCHHINDLKNVLKNEGHILKPYKKDEMLGVSRRNMFYSNRILRDTSFLTFLFFVLSVLILYRFKSSFLYPDKALLIIGLCGLIIPVAGITKYLIEPKRRQKAVFNFKVVFSYSIMIFLLVFVINLIISLVTPSIGLTMRDLQLYPPALLALFIPFSVIFYQLLYKSGVYKVKLS